jgi:predicted neuraminidase
LFLREERRTGSWTAQVVPRHDLHAALLALLGLDHERLTFRCSGGDFRLTDAHGRVIRGMLAAPVRRGELRMTLANRFCRVVPQLLVAWAACQPVGLVAGQEAACRIEDVFPPQAEHVHSSSVVECPDGSLLACWFQGSGERKAADVRVQGARRRVADAAWSPPFLMADTPEFPDCNPVLFIDRRQRLWLFWICVLAERWECSQLKYRRAETAVGDGPPRWTWQDVLQLKPGERFGRVLGERLAAVESDEGAWSEYAPPYRRMLEEAAADPYKRQTGWMTRTRPLTLPSGRIVLPLYSDGFNVSLMALSDDDGDTWRAGEPLAGFGPIQPAVARRRDGSLTAYCRDSGGKPYRVLSAASLDDGETWSPAVDTDVPNPGSSLDVLALRDGRWAMVANDTEDQRDRLTLLASADEGRTWTARREIEPRTPRGERFSYPSLLQAEDGTLHVTYTAALDAGNAIRHAVLPLEWLPTPAP